MQHDDYLEHKDFKYIEKIKDGIKTRYFYTKEALQGYYNNLKEKHKGIGAAEVKLGRVFGPKRKLTKEQKQQNKSFRKQEKTYRKEEQKNFKEGLKSVKKKQKADARSARITYIKNTPVRVKNAAKRAWNRIWQGSKAKAKLDAFKANYKKAKTDKLRNKLGLPTSKADIDARKNKINSDIAWRRMNTTERRKTLGLPYKSSDIRGRRSNLHKRTDANKYLLKNKVAERTKANRDSLDPKKNGAMKRRYQLGLPSTEGEFGEMYVNRRRAEQKAAIGKVHSTHKIGATGKQLTEAKLASEKHLHNAKKYQAQRKAEHAQYARKKSSTAKRYANIATKLSSANVVKKQSKR